MKIRRTARWVLGVCVALGMTPMGVYAQGGTATTGTGTNSGATAGGSASSGSGAGGTNVFTTPSGLVQPVPLLAASNTASSATTSPSTYNNYYNTYVNPTSLGMPSIYATNLGPPTKYTGSMGKGLYLANATTTSTGTASTTSNAGVGFSTQPTPRSPAYYTVLGEGLTPRNIAPKTLSSELAQKFANSSYFKKGDAIQVEVGNGGVVLLRGLVATETERLRAEGMIRVTPGVSEVQNQLQVVTTSN